MGSKQPKKSKRFEELSIMVIGLDGSGKSTFCKYVNPSRVSNYHKSILILPREWQKKQSQPSATTSKDASINNEKLPFTICQGTKSTATCEKSFTRMSRWENLDFYELHNINRVLCLWSTDLINCEIKRRMISSTVSMD